MGFCLFWNQIFSIFGGKQYGLHTKAWFLILYLFIRFLPISLFRYGWYHLYSLLAFQLMNMCFPQHQKEDHLLVSISFFQLVHINSLNLLFFSQPLDNEDDLVSHYFSNNKKKYGLLYFFNYIKDLAWISPRKQF